MKILSTLSLLFFSFQSYAQNSSQVANLFPVLPKAYKWPTKKNDSQKILNFLKTEKENYFSYFNKDFVEFGIDFTRNGLIRSLHAIDLNKDGIDEIIFAGQSEEEGNRVDIFKKEKTSFARIFSERQNLTDFMLSQGQLYLRSWMLC
jgi:hypothetical protein